MSVNNQSITLPTWFTTTEKNFTEINKAAGCSRGVVNVINQMHPTALANPVKTFFQATKFIGGCNIFFAIPNLVKNIYDAAMASSIVVRIKKIAQAILSAGAIPAAIADFFNGLKAVKILSEAACRWTAIASKILYPLQFISLGLVIHQVQETGSLSSTLKESIKLPKNLSLDARVENLTKACKHVQENSRKLQSSLRFCADTHLDKQATLLLERLASTTEEKASVVAEGETFIKSLSGRVKTKLVSEVLAVALKIISVIVTGLVLFTPTTLVLSIAAAAVTVVGIVLSEVTKLALNNNPYRTPENNFERIVEKMRQAIQDTAKNMYKTGKKIIGGCTGHALNLNSQTQVRA